MLRVDFSTAQQFESLFIKEKAHKHNQFEDLNFDPGIFLIQIVVNLYKMMSGALLCYTLSESENVFI